MLTKAVFKNVFRPQPFWLWVVVTLLFWLCLNALTFSQNCVMLNWKTGGCGRGNSMWHLVCFIALVPEKFCMHCKLSIQ